MQITPRLLRSWGAFYNGTELARLVTKRRAMTPLELWESSIPQEERCWALLRPAVIPAPQLAELALALVETTLPLWRECYPDRPELQQALDAKRARMRGEICSHQMAPFAAAVWRLVRQLRPRSRRGVEGIHATVRDADVFRIATAAKWALHHNPRLAAVGAINHARLVTLNVEDMTQQPWARQERLVQELLAQVSGE